MIAHPQSFGGSPTGSVLKSRGFSYKPAPQDSSFVGTFLGSTLIDISSSRVKEYIERTGDKFSWYSGGSPFEGRACAPATLFPSHSSIDSAWFLPNMHGNLHARQEWQFFAPMLVGDQVLATRTIVDRYEKRGRIYLVCEASFSEASSGQLLARQRQHQSFVSDQSSEAIAAWKKGTSSKRTGKVINKSRPLIPHPDTTDHVEKFGPVRRTASKELCERFAGHQAGETFGNGHLDSKEATGMGFPGIVVVGVLSACFLSELMTTRFGRGFYEGGSMDIKFTRPLWLGDTVEAWGVVRRWEPSGPGRRRAICDIWCHSMDGTVTALGTATAFDEGHGRGSRL
jgi:acyl dehydratase